MDSRCGSSYLEVITRSDEVDDLLRDQRIELWSTSVKRLGADVLPSSRNGSPEDTDLERNSLGGPRIKHLRELFVFQSGARSRSRTLCCVKRVRVSQLVNTAESLLGY